MPMHCFDYRRNVNDIVFDDKTCSGCIHYRSGKKCPRRDTTRYFFDGIVDSIAGRQIVSSRWISREQYRQIKEILKVKRK